MCAILNKRPKPKPFKAVSCSVFIQEPFKNKNIKEKARTLAEILMNISKNFILYINKYPEWINALISSLEKMDHSKRFYNNPPDYNKDLLNNQANGCTKLIIQVKENRFS